MPRRGLPFSSLGDSVNNYNIRHSDGLFAHVVTSNQRTFDSIRDALVASGLPASAINLLAVPSELGLFNDVFSLGGGQARLGTHYEVVLRLFRFHNQTEGDAYLKSFPPTFYLKAEHLDDTPLEASKSPAYKSRKHPDSVREGARADDFAAYGASTLQRVGRAFHRHITHADDQNDAAAAADAAASAAGVSQIDFAPLLIRGLECLERHTECLGDCPDAAYYGPNVHADRDSISMLKLSTDDEVHVIVAVNHRQLNASVYGSLAMLRPHPVTSPVLSKTRMSVRATSLGVTSFDFASTHDFVAWAFTRNAEHCTRLAKAEAVDGCSVITESQVPRSGFLTYCERVYLNPVTGTGPSWDDLLAAKLFHIQLDQLPLDTEARSTARAAARAAMPRGLPGALPLAEITDGSGRMRFFHIIKTGGESLELHLAKQPAPRLDYSHCRRAGRASGFRANLTASANLPCAAAAAGVSAILCSANCECCAADTRVPGGFHGVLLRSPRAHMLSLFSHCHTAHTQNSLRRSLDDVPQYLAEAILRSTEWTCGSYCGISFDPTWERALREALQHPVVQGDKAQEMKALRVLPLHNTQAHALTCSTARGSLGQHFRILDGQTDGDALQPEIDAALASVHRFEWVGLTDLFDHSMCLLHFQANGSLPAACSCAANDGKISLGLPRFNHGVARHDPSDLPADVLALLDEHTAADAQLFATGLRLLLGRLRAVEQRTGAELLECIDWGKLWRATSHIPGLWAAPDVFLA